MYGRVQHCIFNFKLWKDPRLSWNHSDYGGTSNISLSANEVWILNMGLRNRYRIIYWSGMIFYGIILYIVGCSKLWDFAMLNDYLNSIIIIWYICIYIFMKKTWGCVPVHCTGSQYWTRALKCLRQPHRLLLCRASEPLGHDPLVKNGSVLSVWYQTPGTAAARL